MFLRSPRTALKPRSSNRSAAGLSWRVDGFCEKQNRPHFAAGRDGSLSMDTVEACISITGAFVYRSYECLERYSCRLNKARPRPIEFRTIFRLFVSQIVPKLV
jgi:hypothetical protein